MWHNDKCAKSEYKLLAKYSNLKYIWPKDGGYAATISNASLTYVQKALTNPGDGFGWGVILLPKGIEYDPTMEIFYETIIIQPSKEDVKSEFSEFHMLIAATQQDNDIICLDKDGKVLKAKEVFTINFPKLVFKKWQDFEDNHKINCSPNWKEPDFMIEEEDDN